MFVRFYKEDQPSSSEAFHPSPVDIYGPRGPIPHTLVPFAPEGEIIAWDARFSAPPSGSRKYNLRAEARWIDEQCEGITQWVTWIFSVQKRQPQ
jgi:hypothetical protein